MSTTRQPWAVYGPLSIGASDAVLDRVSAIETRIRQQLGVPTGDDETVRELVGEYLLDRCRALIRSTEIKSEEELYRRVTESAII